MAHTYLISSSIPDGKERDTLYAGLSSFITFADLDSAIEARCLQSPAPSDDSPGTPPTLNCVETLTPPCTVEGNGSKRPSEASFDALPDVINLIDSKVSGGEGTYNAAVENASMVDVSKNDVQKATNDYMTSDTAENEDMTDVVGAGGPVTALECGVGEQDREQNDPVSGGQLCSASPDCGIVPISSPLTSRTRLRRQGFPMYWDHSC